MVLNPLATIIVVVLCCSDVSGEKDGKKIVHSRQADIKIPNFQILKDAPRAAPLLTFTPTFLRFSENSTFESLPNFQNVQQQTIDVKASPQIITPIVQRFQFSTSSQNTEDILELDWYNFKQAFRKTYDSATEERRRKEIFIENRNKVAKFNLEYALGLRNFVQKLNGYADMLHHEFNQQLNGFNRTARYRSAPNAQHSAFIKSANAGVPSRIDWREFGAVTSVRSQGNCGACYAFAAAGALEGQHFRKTGQLVELSAQNIIDCSTSHSNSGCVGGVMEYAYEYIKDNKGVAREVTYPFEGKDGFECRYTQEKYGAHDTGYVLIDEGDEQGLESAVAHLGPVSVAIDASSDAFQFYSNGVYYEPSCKNAVDSLNHAVLIVGYGTEPNGQGYWLVKNSYGTAWGIGGYMKMAKFSNNHCGIASYASYPLV